MKKAFLSAVLPVICIILSAQPIALHPENPHYFLYKGKPTVLITSCEHYGSVINPDFDFDLYLETIHKEGFNHTRIFMGDYGEGPNSFCILHNTLEAAPGRFLAPWKRSEVPGYALGGNKFDLDHWNPAYFERLHRFMQKASDLGIVVETDLFFVGMSWDLMPMNPKNNINGTKAIEPKDYMSLSNGNILDYQKKYCLKLVDEMNKYDNLIIDIANEPWFFNQEHEGFSSPARDETKEWIREVSGWIVDEESRLPKKHLISVDYCNEGRLITPEELEKYWKNISVFNHHYDRDAVSVRLNYDQTDRAFAFNETGLMPPNSDEYRIQGWRYLMCGGALYNNLDFTFTTGHEDGTGTAEFSCEWYEGCGDPGIKKEMSALAGFFSSIDFVHMHPAKDLLPVYFGDKDIYVLANEGKQYAVYIVGGKNTWTQLSVPDGTYQVDWIDPATGNLITSSTGVSQKENLRLHGPDYKTDLAIRINRKP
jgi:hypothetical protein